MNIRQIKLFSSQETDNWQTPPELYQALNTEFNFDCDPCPLDPLVDGLKVRWGKRTFVNPPYSQIEKWLEKAHQELETGDVDIIVFLVFANTDTDWFHKYIYNKAEIRFLKGRLQFLDSSGNKKNSAMRPSMIVIFRKIFYTKK